MGSPLGPTLADFYMSHVKSKLLKQRNKASNPIIYLRYEDEIFAILKLQKQIRFFMDQLERNPVLKFTFKRMRDGRFNFLDVSLKETSNGHFEK